MNTNRWPVAFIIGLPIVLLHPAACAPTGESRAGTGEAIKFEQYYVQGEALYKIHCSNCHQQNGEGLRRVYPPLDTSDFMEENFVKTICLIKNGISGELEVNGKKYNQIMDGAPQLSALEIAEIATYIYNRGSHRRGIVEINVIGEALAQCR